ncbi:MAG: SpoIIE family protein phosphatase [Candidatus Promineifilaceae bacterium]
MPVTYANILIAGQDEQSLADLHKDLRGLVLYEIAVAHSVPEVNALARERSFDIVLLDVSLRAQCTDPEQFFDQWRQRMPAAAGAVPAAAGAVPVIMTGRAADFALLTECIELGADDYLILPTNPTLLKARIRTHVQRKRLQEQALASLHAFNEVEKLADDLRLVILPLGIALSAERDFGRLLERIVETAMELTHADAGSLFMLTEDNKLHYGLVRVNSLGLAYGGTAEEAVPFDDLPLYDEAGEPVLENVVTYAVHQEIPINISDVYNESAFDFSGTKAFDARNNYRSISCLTIPLRTRHVIGVLQLRNARDAQSGETVPFDVYQQLVAESLASQAAVALQTRRLRTREATLLRYKRELEIGRDIQSGFLPRELPEPPGWEIAAYFYPAREVAGDFYDVFAAPDGRLGLVIADVCDKGIVAALFMALLRSLLRAFIQQYLFESAKFQVRNAAFAAGSAEETVTTARIDEEALLSAIYLTNAYIIGNHLDLNIFATLFIGILDPATGELVYANCGHLPPRLRRLSGEEQRLMPTGPAVGLLPETTFQIEKTVLEAGDLLFAYTDGVVEAKNPEGEMFGEARLTALLDEHGSETAEALLAAIETAGQDFIAGGEPSDDVTMLAVKNS